MQPLETHDAVDLHHVLPHAHRLDAVAHGPAHQRLDVRVGVVEVPDPAIERLQGLAAHQRMVGGRVLQVVNVHVRIHRHAALIEDLVVLRARQRRQDGELENIDRQLALDDLQVVGDGFGRIGGKADDVAGIGHDPGVAPLLEHAPVLGDLVLIFLGRLQVLRVDVLEPDEGMGAAGPRGLFDEARGLVAQGVDLNQEVNVETILLPQRDHAVEQGLPVLVAREVVVGDEVAADALGDVGADDALDIVGGAIARLAALDVDDGAEAALERTAAAGIEARNHAVVAAQQAFRQERDHLALQARQIGQVVVDRRQASGDGVAQERLQALLGFAGKEGQAQVLGLLQVGRQLVEHRQAAGDVEAAHRHRHAGLAELARDVHGARKLVRLHADQAHQPEIAVVAEPPDQLVEGDQRVHLVVGVQHQFDLVPEHVPLRQVERQAVDGGERVRRDPGLPPLDHVAVVVIVRRLDHD